MKKDKRKTNSIKMAYDSNRKLRLSTSNKKIAGVLGGIAEYLDVDATAIRALYVILTLFTAFSGIILYPILWMIIPNKETL
jgi:phage shock protein C